MMMSSRIPSLSHFLWTTTTLLLVLLQCQVATSHQRNNAVSANPLLGVFNRYPLQQQRRRVVSSRRKEPCNFHDVLLCNNNDNTDDDDDDDEDDLMQVSNLALSSGMEQRFFRQTESALLSNNGDRNVVECSAATTAATIMPRPLVFWENMLAGAISRSIAQTVMHPANTMKTILQSTIPPPTIASLLHPSQFQRLSVGAGANFILSVPHGAVNFAVLELVRAKMALLADATGMSDSMGPAMDFLSSCISTICCSVVSTPQMMITDNIMAGNYPNLVVATKGLYQSQGIAGFYSGWFPGLAGKIPSYALTWTLFQQLKDAHRRAFHDRNPNNVENSIMGCVASGTTVIIMIPLDTIKTRLVTQSSMAYSSVPYKGIVDCAIRVYKEEGLATFYRGLPPRLVSVVPMIGIQFGVYEYMKRQMQERRRVNDAASRSVSNNDATDTFQEATMEVAADSLQPFPAPQFHPNDKKENTKKRRGTKR